MRERGAAHLGEGREARMGGGDAPRGADGRTAVEVTGVEVLRGRTGSRVRGAAGSERGAGGGPSAWRGRRRVVRRVGQVGRPAAASGGGGGGGGGCRGSGQRDRERKRRERKRRTGAAAGLNC